MNNRISSSEFKQAIRQSLAVLKAKGLPITQAKVIKNAKCPDGTSVGKTTLYRKNERTGNSIHSDLIEEIENAKTWQNRGKGKKSRKETIAGLNNDKKKLREELNALYDQVAEQEAEIEKLKKGGDREASEINSLQSELYVAHSVIIGLYPGRKEFSELNKAFEMKHSGTEQLEHLKKRVERLVGDLQYSTVFNVDFGNK